MKVERRAVWSLYAGKYQVWFKIAAEEHGVAGLSDLTTPSFYSAEERPPFRGREFLGTLARTKSDVRVRVGVTGRITLGREELRPAGEDRVEVVE